MKKTALVITTYNQPLCLELCLESLTNQTNKNFDIFIADDGSTSETRELINRYRLKLPNNLFHFWHEDQGYRKAAINNRVFRELSAYQIAICIDGDTLCHYRFIEDHVNVHAQNEHLLFMGRRVDLGPLVTAWLSPEKICGFNRGLSLRLLTSGLKKDSKNITRAIRIAFPALQKFFKKNQVQDLLGSNFSIATSLLFEVNGYNEDYRSYWGEDGDLFVRARNSDAKIVGNKALALQYHLNHPRLEPTASHQDIYRRKLADPTYKYCSNGIVKEDSQLLTNINSKPSAGV